MGRPLNKKYFGNRNIGSASTAADNGIGGKQVGSAAITVVGSYTTRPTFTFTAADLASLGGVTATGTVTSEALSAAVTTPGTGYTVGDLLTLTSAGGSAIAYVATITGGGGTGPIGTVNFTGTGASRGSFEALPGAKFPATLTGGRLCDSSAASGTGAELTVTFRGKAVVITEPGSGYTAAPTIAGYTNQGGITVATITLAADTGSIRSATNQENSIQMTARLTGGSAVVVDIIKQVSARRFKVTDGTRTGIVKLKSSVATAAGEGSIRLVDSDTGTYFATKITSRKVTVTRGTGSQAAFVTGGSVKWNMTAATADSLLIDNA
jgi:hypothetical protein